MSHITTVKTAFRLPDAIQLAAATLKVPLAEQVPVRFYAGPTQEIYPYVLQLPGRYDLGFALQPDGTYTLIGDEEIFSEQENSRNRDARDHLGPQAQWLHREYQVGVAALVAQQHGYQMARLTREDGWTQIVLTQ